MENSELEILKRALEREKIARRQAETILEQKSRNLLLISKELKVANQKLQNLLDEKSTQLQGVFENINDAYIVIDLEGNVIKMNDIARDLFEYDLGEKQINVNDLIYASDKKYAYKSFRDLTEKGAFSNYTGRIVTKSNTVKWIQMNGSLIFSKNNRPVAAQGILRDITRIKNLEQQKEKILKELEDSNNQLQEYAHIVSHDLKSPLRSLHALVSWIKADNENIFDETTSQNFLLIENTLETMDDLISNVLEYSSAGYNNNIDDDKEIDLNILISDLKAILYTPENFTIRVNKKLPSIKADKTKIQQVFQNLMSNSIKFIDKEVGVVTIDYTDTETHHEFSIEDNGIGIEEKYHHKIFDIFQSLNKSKDSTGVGLSIVKKIITLYGGKIWLKSTPNVGTTFFFTIKK